MNKFQWMTSLSVVALLLASCAGGGDSNNATQTPANADSTAQAPGQPVTKTVSVPAKTQNFTNPLVGKSGSGRAMPVPGLVQPTNATERLPQIAAGRSDPFAAIAANPVIIPGANPQVRSVPSVPAVPALIRTNRTPKVAAPKVVIPSARRTLPPVAVAPLSTTPLPSVRPAPSDLSKLPPLPVPSSPTSLASAVTVNGVVQAGDSLSAIVKAPEEQTSRYVSAGEYLSNGKILVKRIEMRSNSEPVVILQQDGIEITKFVGNANGPVASAL